MKLPSLKNQQGVLPLYILIAVIGLIAFFLLAFVGPFKDKLFTSLYPKPSSNAAQPDDFEKGQPLGRVPDQILVKFKDNAGQAKKDEILNSLNLKQKDEIKQLGIKIINIPPNKTPEEVVSDLNTKHSDIIEFAEIDGIVSALFTPNDPNYPSMWQHTKINTPAAWDNANGSGITIAIADSGVEATHPDLVANLVPGWNFYDNNSNTADIHGHGTAVAGSAAAVGNNANQIAGVAWNTKIMPLRISYKDTDGKVYATSSTMVKAITYAADKGVKIVNISYGGLGWCADQDRSVKSAATYLSGKGGLTFFAAGNNSVDTNCTNNPDIITSSATDSNDAPASFTSFGNNVDVASPGVNVSLTRTGGVIGTGSGTSYASPITAGEAALVWQANPSLTPAQVTDILTKSADDLGASGFDKYFGWGRINAGNAVALAKNYSPSSTPAPTSAPSPSASVNPSTAPTESTPPTVSITSPANGSSVKRNTTFTITANASDNVAVSKVEFYVDGILSCTDTSASYACPTKVSGKPGASHSIMAKAYDASDNYSSATVNIMGN